MIIRDPKIEIGKKWIFLFGETPQTAIKHQFHRNIGTLTATRPILPIVRCLKKIK